MRSYWMLPVCLLLGCATPTSNSPDSQSSAAAETFELRGSWTYTGGVAGLTNHLEITDKQMKDWGDYKGTGWTIMFAIESWDNDANQALLKVAKIEGFSRYALGAPLYLSWQPVQDTLALYIGEDHFLEPSGGTEGKEFVTYSRP